MNTLRVCLLAAALLCLSLSFPQAAEAAKCDGTAPKVRAGSLFPNPDGVSVTWTYDGPSDCKDAYNFSWGLVGGRLQQVELPGANCPSVVDGVPQTGVCRHDLSVPFGMRYVFSIQACNQRTFQSSECSQWGRSEYGPFVFPLTESNGVIYSVAGNNDLLWAGHNGRGDGAFRWTSNESKPVGHGWSFKQIFSGGDGIIYVINEVNDLMWYRHEGRNDGTFRWAFAEGKPVGFGWSVKQIFSGGDGIIYVIKDNGDLLWYRHDGRNDGTFRWAFAEGKPVGFGWNFKHVFYGGNGIIYAITDGGDLLWYRHDGRNDGTFRWAFEKGKPVGHGWNFKQVFSSGDGIIYAIQDNGDLLWYRHDGRNDGTFRWAFEKGKPVGHGWSFKQVFSGATLH